MKILLIFLVFTLSTASIANPSSSTKTVQEILDISSEADSGVNFTKHGEKVYMGCCKICTSGCACGDSCISCSYNCTKPYGCACDG